MKEKEEVKENGQAKTKVVEPTKVVLSVKQREAIMLVLAEKTLAQKAVTEAQAKEATITELILDAHGINPEDAVSVALDANQVMFSVTLKKKPEKVKEDG